MTDNHNTAASQPGNADAMLIKELNAQASWVPSGPAGVMHRAAAAIAATQPPAASQPSKLSVEVIGCFAAAEAEGLTEALAITTDLRLKDLVERRLMHALYAALYAAQGEK